MSKNIPDWLNKHTPILHRSDIVFMVMQIQTERIGRHKQFALDALKNRYPVVECRPVTIEDFNQPKAFISDIGFKVTVKRHPQGLLVNDRVLIEIKFELDENLSAAQSLATAFNGSIYSQEDSNDW